MIRLFNRIHSRSISFMRRSSTTNVLEKSPTLNLDDDFNRYRRDISDLRREASTVLRLLEIDNKDKFRLLPDKRSHSDVVRDIISDLDVISNYCEQIFAVAPLFDFRDVKANGYRSFLMITNKCCVILLNNIRSINHNYKPSNWTRSRTEDLNAFSECWHELSRCLYFLQCMIRLDDAACKAAGPGYQHSLFSQLDALASPEVQLILDESNKLRQDIFYGKCLGFQYCNSAQRIFQVLGSFMSGYAHSFITNKSGVRGVFNTMMQTVTCFWRPEARGQHMAAITKHATVDFTKQFWNLGEHPLVLEAPNIILPPVDVAVSFSLPPIPFSVLATNEKGAHVNTIISPPSLVSTHNIKLRLISFRLREGLNWISSAVTSQVHQCDSPDLKQRRSPMQVSNEKRLLQRMSSSSSVRALQQHNYRERSKCLLIHCHGGGFVAQSAKAHDMYLRSWAERLDCPILSVDYSLAPEFPFPTAVDECFYSLSWALHNLRQLGCTADARVVLCGDSAGANLALCATLRALQIGVSVPHGLFLAYIPSLVSMSPSPARLMSSLDPLLPVGILARCLLAYVGINETQLIESNSDFSSPTQLNSKSRESGSRMELSDLTDTTKASPLNIVRKAHIPTDPFMSPLLADKALLAKLPPITIIGTHLDPLLDDCVEMCKRIDSVGVPVQLEILHDIPHGFLNFVLLSRECEVASQRCLSHISQLFNRCPPYKAP